MIVAYRGALVVRVVPSTDSRMAQSIPLHSAIYLQDYITILVPDVMVEELGIEAGKYIDFWTQSKRRMVKERRMMSADGSAHNVVTTSCNNPVITRVYEENPFEMAEWLESMGPSTVDNMEE